MRIGSHTLNVFLTADTTSDMQRPGSSGNPFTAGVEVTAVAEPASRARPLAGSGAIGFVARRRAR